MTSPYIICENQVHVWISDLALQGQKSFHATLSPSEALRAEKFRFLKDRNRYERTRGILRLLLGEYFNAPPGKIEIPTTEFGKPYVSELLHGQTLSFNLSHTGGVAVYAFCLNHPVGVDVETVRPIPDLDGLAARFFTENERSVLQDVEPQARIRLFLQYWTRKEAYLKALGLGLRISPEEVNAASVPVPAEELTPFHPQIKSDQNAWSLMDFFPTDGSVAAIVVASSVTQIQIENI